MTDWRSQLRILRGYHGLKQAALAEMLRIDQATVSRWENGRQEPDLAGRRRLRDLLRKFSSRIEVDVKALLSSPITERSLIDAEFVLRDVSNATIRNLQMDKESLVGKFVPALRDDREYDAMLTKYHNVIRVGEFTSMHGTFFSAMTSSWTEAYVIPVLANGSIYLLSERRRIVSPVPLRRQLTISLLE
jgi:transcriptional regulator with XRE-family HTH domain